MRVLVIDTDRDLLETIYTSLREEFIVDIAFNGYEALNLFSINEYDALIVDFQLHHLCEQPVDVPVIALLNENEIDLQRKLYCYEKGIGWFIQKPLEIAELKAVLNYSIKKTRPHHETVVINTTCKTVIVNGISLFLRCREFALFEYLYLHKNTRLSKQRIYLHVWPDNHEVASNTLEVHVSRLKRELRKVKGAPQIKTVKNFGYMLVT